MTTPTLTPTTTADPPRLGSLRTFSVLNGIVALAVLLQGVWAGGFMGRLGGADWVVLHQISAYAAASFALAAAIVAVVALRRHSIALVIWPIVLFLLLIAETGIGHAIGGAGGGTPVAFHVPLAMLIMGLAVYLSIAAVTLRHRLSSGR